MGRVGEPRHDVVVQPARALVHSQGIVLIDGTELSRMLAQAVTALR